MQAVQGFFDPLLPGPAVEGFDFRLERVQVRVLVGGQIQLDHMTRAGQPGAGRDEHCCMRVQAGFLRNIGDAQVLLQLQCAVVWFF